MQTEDRKLVEVKLTQIEANTGSAEMKKPGGTLESTVNMQIGSVGDGRALAEVRVVVTGIPQGAKKGEAAFTISITGVGIWEWADKSLPSQKELETDRMLLELCSSVHTLVVSEISRVALALGFPGVALPWSLRSASDAQEEAPEQAQKKTRRRRPVLPKE